MKLRIALIAALGLAAAVYLFAYAGWSAVLAAALAVGPGGFLCYFVSTLLLFPLLGLAWYVLLPRGAHTRPWVLVWARLLRDAAGEVLPFSQLGAIVIGSRAAILHGLARPLAYGSIIVDVTTELLAQIAYVVLGVALLALHAPPAASLSPALRLTIAGGLTLLLTGGVTFVLLQRHGHRLVNGLAARLLPGTVATTESIAGALDVIYASRARVAAAAALHLAGWVGSALTSWVALHLIGVHVDLASVVVLESLVCAARSAGVVVPSALGVQEAAYAVLMPLFGVAPQVGLALSLLRRARDLVLGLPALLVWQTLESRRVLMGATPLG
jgi:putative membrane protein